MALKDEVLSYFINHSNVVISGQQLAEYFHVTRGAIWKVIRQLNDQGYKIKGKNNLGYFFDQNLNIYSKECLSSYLNNNFHIEIFDSIDSTSTYIKKIIDEYNDPCLVLAYSQTNGKGRVGKRFISSPGGIYFSFAMKDIQSLNIDLFTIKVAVATHLSLSKFTKLQCQIKWVNDIYYQNKKAAGILCEALIDFESNYINSLIVGIGINLFNVKFDDELKDIATSLNVTSCNVNGLIAFIINEVLNPTMSIQEILSYYKKNCFILNKEITFIKDNIEYQGIALDINEQGHLLVKVNENIMCLQSGEVTLKKYEK
ncbi:MAG: biotin--[acetyl-CoA-carboxylase] ligase [Erysipelotrichaceae bacterium]|nr:biotin--[acetyl-CoA-carboxylase] ligase [Erysipelotrichaceae bacterium]